MMTGSLKKTDLKKNKNLKDFFFFNFKKRGGLLIRACSLIRSNTVCHFAHKIMHSVPQSWTCGQWPCRAAAHSSC